uniref:hypothetical protein n=1 Tax=Carboxylicivirga TaxID=1628153 RepID=UPI003D351C6A
LTEAASLRNRSDRLMRYGGLLGAAIYNFFQDALQKRAENLCVTNRFLVLIFLHSMFWRALVRMRYFEVRLHLNRPGNQSPNRAAPKIPLQIGNPAAWLKNARWD